MNLLKKRTYKHLAAATVLFAGLLGGTAAAAFHHRNPSFFHRGNDSLQTNVELRNLSRQRGVRVDVDARARVRVECINPGGQRPPGAQPGTVTVRVSGSQTYSRHAIGWGGRLNARVTTDRIGSVIPGAPNCPNPNWTERVIERPGFVAARVRARQGNRRVLDLDCTFDRTRRNRSARGVSCRNRL
jgi:hypothetical protein